MKKTKIDWCDSTWNPVTGCYHDCEYCYARKIAERFSGYDSCTRIENACHITDELLESAKVIETWEDLSFKSWSKKDENGRPAEGAKLIRAPYPFGFKPTFHRELLNIPHRWKKPRNIFVCSMADMFGNWVPNDWKIEVLEACAKAPQHNYLFLTKNSFGYGIWPTEKHKHFDDVDCYTPNMWLGVTYTGTERYEPEKFDKNSRESCLGIHSNFWYLWRMSSAITPTNGAHKFISIEPLKCDICEIEDEREGGKLLKNFLLPRGYKSFFEWVIVGAETGNRKGKIAPKREWIEKIVDLCRQAEIPIFMKSSLADIWGELLIQEFPKGLQRTVETPGDSQKKL